MAENKSNLDNFLLYLKNRKSEQTVLAYQTDLLQFLRYIGGAELETVESKHIDSFLSSLQLSRKSLARKLSALSSFFRFLKKQGVRKDIPTEEVERFTIPKRMPDFLSEQEIKRLHQVEPIRDLTMIELLLSTGIRVSELCSINKWSLDFETRQIKVIGKGDKERLVMFSGYCSQVLKAYLTTREDDNEALFVNRKSQRMSRNSVEYRISKIGKQYLGRHLYPHLLRHTFATYLLDKGATLPDVQRLLGHESLAVTSIYVHPTGDMRARYDRAIEQI